MKDCNNYIGRRFGRLLTIDQYRKYHEQSECDRLFLVTVCDCGKSKTFLSTNLVRKKNSVLSCGCLPKRLENGKYISGREFHIIKSGARIRDLLFEITISDIEKKYLTQDKKCFYTRISLRFNKLSKRVSGKEIISLGNASVDRIDSSKGYTKDNIQIVHKDINRMKLASSHEDFIRMCHKVADYSQKGVTHE